MTVRPGCRRNRGVPVFDSLPVRSEGQTALWRDVRLCRGGKGAAGASGASGAARGGDARETRREPVKCWDRGGSALIKWSHTIRRGEGIVAATDGFRRTLVLC